MNRSREDDSRLQLENLMRCNNEHGQFLEKPRIRLVLLQTPTSSCGAAEIESAIVSFHFIQPT